MKIVDKISISELKDMAARMYGNLVKADVDISKNIFIVDMGMHADGEAFLLNRGSEQNDLWGINLYPSDYGTDDFIEFDSMINIRPRQDNPSRDILNQEIRSKIINLVNNIVHD